MHYGGWGLWRMHVFWRLFRTVLIAVLFSLFPPVPWGWRRTMLLELLQRRYAAQAHIR
jgi:hypothetical protein